MMIYRFKLNKKLYTLYAVRDSMCTHIEAEPYGWFGPVQTKWVRRRLHLDDFELVGVREERKNRTIDITRISDVR